MSIMRWNVLTALILNLAVGLPPAPVRSARRHPRIFSTRPRPSRPMRTGKRRSAGSVSSSASTPVTRAAAEARFWIGFSLVKSDEFEEAIRELEPFESTLAQDKWADDALLQLGHAYRGHDDDNKALAVWKRLRAEVPGFGLADRGRASDHRRVISLEQGLRSMPGLLRRSGPMKP